MTKQTEFSIGMWTKRLLWLELYAESMNNIRIVVVISIVIVLAIAFVFSSVFNNLQTSNQQTPTPTAKPITNVNITNFHFTNFFPAEGLSWNAGFVLELTNNETEKVDNLTLTFNSESPYNMTRTIRFYNNTSLSNQIFFEMGQQCFLGSLQQGETKLLYGAILDNMDDYYRIRGYAFDVTLRIGDIVLDQALTDIPGPVFNG